MSKLNELSQSNLDLDKDAEVVKIKPKLTDQELAIAFEYCYRLSRLISLELAKQDPFINFDHEIPEVLSALSLMYKRDDVETFKKNYGERFYKMLKDVGNF